MSGAKYSIRVRVSIVGRPLASAAQRPNWTAVAAGRRSRRSPRSGLRQLLEELEHGRVEFRCNLLSRVVAGRSALLEQVINCLFIGTELPVRAFPDAQEQEWNNRRRGPGLGTPGYLFFRLPTEELHGNKKRDGRASGQGQEFRAHLPQRRAAHDDSPKPGN